MNKAWIQVAALSVAIMVSPLAWSDGDYGGPAIREGSYNLRGDDNGGSSPSYNGIERTNSTTGSYNHEGNGKRSTPSYSSSSNAGSRGNSYQAGPRYDYEKEIWVNPADDYLTGSGYASSARNQGTGSYDSYSDSYDKRNFGNDTSGYTNSSLDHYVRSDLDYSNYRDAYEAGLDPDW